MKTIAHYDPFTPTLDLEYDRDAQALFFEAAQAAEQYFREERDNFEPDPTCLESVAAFEGGVGILSILGRAHSRQLRVPPEELRKALNVVCLTVVGFLQKGRSVAPFHRAVYQLATVTPHPISPPPLPPSSEVFELARTPEVIIGIYEVIRSWNLPHEQQIFLVPLYELWRELAQVGDLNADLQEFEYELRQVTGVFRFAMHYLAIEEVKAESVIGKDSLR